MAIEQQNLEPLDPQTIADFTDSELTPMQAYWARVNVKAAELDPRAAQYDNAIRASNPKHQNGFMAASTKVIFITSEKTPAKSIRSGRVFSVPPLLAAKLIVDGTHRISTAEETDSWKSEQQSRVREAEALVLAKQPPTQINVHLPPEALNREPRVHVAVDTPRRAAADKP